MMRRLSCGWFTLLFVLATFGVFSNLRQATHFMPGSMDTSDHPTVSESSPVAATSLSPNSTIFHCGGYATNRNFEPTWRAIFPTYQWINLKYQPNWKNLTTTSRDMFISSYQLDDCMKRQRPKQVAMDATQFQEWLHEEFAGKIVLWTPEDGTNYKPLNPSYRYYPIGPGAPLALTFLQTAYWAQMRSLIRNGTNNREHFLIYAHSHCVPERQAAFRLISDKFHLPVHYGGRCRGNVSQAVKFPNRVKLGNWEENVRVYRNFRFCLTMEHVDTPGYLTEKILVAFAAGCIPIYWGSTEIYEFFHKNAFVYWNVSDPSDALDRIRYLEENKTAYQKVVDGPLWAPDAKQKYFSMDGSTSGSMFRKRLVHYLELD